MKTGNNLDGKVSFFLILDFTTGKLKLVKFKCEIFSSFLLNALYSGRNVKQQL
jgi:hypothetical protein